MTLQNCIQGAVGVFFFSVLGCGPVAPGKVSWSVNGEEGVTQGFPSSQLEDGWAVQFSRYQVVVGDMSLQQKDQRIALEKQAVVDLVKGRVGVGDMEDVSAGRWNVGYLIAPAGDAAERHESISEADFETMKTNGWSLRLSGQGVKTGVGVISFDFGFKSAVRMSECTNGVDGTSGLVVPEGGVAQAEMTIHSEHFLYDRLGTHLGVKFRFEAIAAAAGPDKQVTLDELEAQKLFELKDVQGNLLTDAQGQAVLYNPGSYDAQNLKEFVTRSLLDQAHLNGGGLCTLSLEVP
jgi:hypothetical protein